jgi:hypothetical protein
MADSYEHCHESSGSVRDSEVIDQLYKGLCPFAPVMNTNRVSPTGTLYTVSVYTYMYMLFTARHVFRFGFIN